VISLAVLARFLKRNGCIYCENVVLSALTKRNFK
jgi:hypothetical protein